MTQEVDEENVRRAIWWFHVLLIIYFLLIVLPSLLGAFGALVSPYLLAPVGEFSSTSNYRPVDDMSSEDFRRTIRTAKSYDLALTGKEQGTFCASVNDVPASKESDKVPSNPEAGSRNEKDGNGTSEERARDGKCR